MFSVFASFTCRFLREPVVQKMFDNHSRSFEGRKYFERRIKILFPPYVPSVSAVSLGSGNVAQQSRALK